MEKKYDSKPGTPLEELGGVARRYLFGLNKSEAEFAMNPMRGMANDISRKDSQQNAEMANMSDFISRKAAEAASSTPKAPTQYAIDMMAKQDAERAHKESLAGKFESMTSRFTSLFGKEDKKDISAGPKLR